jgi:hypothetical protein
MEGKEITHGMQIKAFYLNLSIISSNIITFQHPVALVNDLICRGSLENATPFRARSLSVGCVVIFFKC